MNTINMIKKRHVHVTEAELKFIETFRYNMPHLRPTVTKTGDGSFTCVCAPVKSIKKELESIASKYYAEVTVRRTGDRSNKAWEHEYVITVK